MKSNLYRSLKPKRQKAGNMVILSGLFTLVLLVIICIVFFNMREKAKSEANEAKIEADEVRRKTSNGYFQVFVNLLFLLFVLSYNSTAVVLGIIDTTNPEKQPLWLSATAVCIIVAAFLISAIKSPKFSFPKLISWEWRKASYKISAIVFFIACAVSAIWVGGVLVAVLLYIFCFIMFFAIVCLSLVS